MNEEILDYKVFLEMLELPDDKISSLLYDLYKYKMNEENNDKHIDKE